MEKIVGQQQMSLHKNPIEISNWRSQLLFTSQNSQSIPKRSIYLFHKILKLIV